MPRFSLIYGTAWKAERTAELATLAYEQGFRAFDTACQPKHYHEPGLGEALARLFETGVERDDLYLQSKFTPLHGQDTHRLPYDANAPLARQIEQSCQRSLDNLGCNYLDALILHTPLPTLAETLEPWSAMEAIAQSGDAQQLGISNCHHLTLLKQLCEQASIGPSIVQNRFYVQSRFDTDIRTWCRQQGVQYQSFWTLTANGALLGSAPVVAAANQHRKTPAQILFRYLKQQGATPLTGTTDRAHMREDLAIEQFALRDDEVRAIDDQLDQLMASSV